MLNVELRELIVVDAGSLSLGGGMVSSMLYLGNLTSKPQI